MTGCGGGSSISQQNSAPIADAGTDISQSISLTAISLDSSGCSDPENDTLSFTWQVIDQPAGANAVISDTTSASPSFVSMVPGDYEIELTVTDPGGLSDADTIAITLTNDPPTISVGSFNRNPTINEDVTIDASASTDPNGHAITYTWELTQRPGNSSMQATYQGASITLRFDAPGEYGLQLQVSDSYDTSTEMWNPIIISTFEALALSNGFSDAEFDKTNHRIVTVLENSLYVIEVDGTEHALSLSLNAAAVSVAPDGATAAVAHDGWVSHVDLNTRVVLATHSVPANLSDIVIDDQGYAYGFPATGSWTKIQIIDLATGTAQESTGYSINDGTRAKLHPSGTKIYGADNGISPSNLERYSIGGGTANLDYDSPYHGDFPFCGDLWMGPGGNSILSRCRVVVRATDERSSDLGFAMQLDSPSQRIRHASSSAFDSQWYLLFDEAGLGSGYVDVYDVDSGNHKDSLALPVVDGSLTQRWIGQFVFATDDSDAVYVLAVDDANPQTFALLKRIDENPPTSNLAPMAIAPRFTTSRVADPVALDASASSDPEGQPITYQWSLIAEPAGSDLAPVDLSSEVLNVTPLVAGVYEFELTVNDGERRSPVAKATVNVFGPTDSLVHRLEGTVIDAEYSKSLDALIYLSGADQTLHILTIADLSESVVPLGRASYTVGVSPDGQYAAVSHAGMASLVNLSTATIADTQTYADDWGDIVLDQYYRAHLVPNRDQWSHLVSIDFAADTSSTVYGAHAGTQIRMHPVSDWVYGADRGLSPSDFEKWDVSVFPSVSIDDSPYHGDYSIAGNIWISEDGDRLVVAGGNTFQSSADPSTDMTYMGSLADNVFVEWADHSTETNAWVIATSDRSREDTLKNKLIFYDDQFFTQLRVEDFEPIPTSIGTMPTKAKQAFYSDDGTLVILLLEGEEILNNQAVQISQP